MSQVRVVVTRIEPDGTMQAFVVSEVNGIWGTAEEVPGTAALNQGGYAFVASVSCAPAGSCGAGGWYTDNTGNSQAFVVSKTHQQTAPRPAAVSPRRAPARPWHWRAPAACRVIIAGSPMRDRVMPLRAMTPYCLIHRHVVPLRSVISCC